MKRTSSTAKRGSDDAPRLTADDFARARHRVGGKDASRAEWLFAVREHIGKRRITIMLDADVLAEYKARAGDRGYQTLINRVLRDALARQDIEAALRRVVREELRARG